MTKQTTEQINPNDAADIGCEFDPKIPIKSTSQFNTTNPYSVPYNTGKVLIGCRYEPPKPDYMGSSGEFWQGILLGDRNTVLYRRAMRACMLVVLLSLVALLLAAWAGV